MGKVQIKLLIIGLLSVFLFAGCDHRQDTLVDANGISNVQKMSLGYIHYTINDGTVMCREHKSRSELACWKIDKKEGLYE